MFQNNGFKLTWDVWMLLSHTIMNPSETIKILQIKSYQHNRLGVKTVMYSEKVILINCS